METTATHPRTPISRPGAALDIRTPAYVFDETTLVADAEAARAAVDSAGAHLLFAMKSCAFRDALNCIREHTDGLHASSLFEARFAREILGENGKVHLTTPAIAPDEIDALLGCAEMISLNSLSQWERFRDLAPSSRAFGLRVNPELSLIRDERYDPCRRHSKLGVPLSRLREVLAEDPDRLSGLSGVLVHSNAESEDFRELLATVRELDKTLGPLLERLDWVNLGGGYLFRPGGSFEPLNEAVALLRERYGVAVYLEPGTSIIQRAGSLVATVLDVFPSGGSSVAVLDASVNHLPEAFEFQFEPSVQGDLKKGGHSSILAGATCLAGDIFGEYAFAEPLQPGDRVTISDVGAYSMVKAHMFNGVNLPSIYWLGTDGVCRLCRQFGYDDFKSRNGGLA